MKAGDLMYQYLGNTGINMYNLLNTLTIIPVLIFNLCQFKEKKKLLGSFAISVLDRTQKNSSPLFLNLAVALEILIVTIFQYAFTGQTNSVFGKIFDTGSNYFGLLYINPILVALICFVLGIKFLKQMDLFTPGFPLALILAKLGCFCHGCCGGAACEFGLYNHRYDAVEFPTQLVEMATAVLLFAFLMIYRKKAEEGTMFPVYLISYSATRFLCQFLRVDFPDIFWCFDIYHILSLAGIAIGLVELYLVKKHRDKITFVFGLFPETIIQIRKALKLAYQKSYQFALKLGIIKEKKTYPQKRRKRKKNIKKIKRKTRKSK